MSTLSYTPKLYTCSCCGIAKPASEFYAQSYTGQLSGQCKECVNIKKKVKRDRIKTSKFISSEKRRNMGSVEYTQDDWKAAMLHFRGKCAYCGAREGRAKAEKFDRDHLVALSRGGKTVRHNIVPACRTCNRGRGNKPWDEWFKRQPFYDDERLTTIKAWHLGVDDR